jgi:tol-pal system protein YbgF
MERIQPGQAIAVRISGATLLLTAILTGCASTPSEQDPVQLKLNDLDARMARIVANQVQLSQRLDEIQSGVRDLQGRMEEMDHSNEVAAKRQRDLYGDLDRRIAALGGPAAGAAAAGGSAGAASRGAGNAAGGAGAAEGTGDAAAGGGAAAATGGTDAAAGTGPSSVEQAVYTQAFDALKAGSYSVAITGFKGFLGTYPSSPLAENAQYWLGEAYYVNREYESAGGAFRTVLKKWPDSRRAPDALLKLGLSQLQQKQIPAARATLEEVTKKYPGTDSAKLAAERLARVPAQ